MKPQGQEENRSHILGSQIYEGKASSWGPVTADGTPQPHLATVEPTPARAWTPQNVPCLRDCRHFMRVVTHFDHGNMEGALESEPTMQHLMCTAAPGVFLELSADSPVYECNRWEPDVDLVDTRRLRQSRYAMERAAEYQARADTEQPIEEEFDDPAPTDVEHADVQPDPPDPAAAIDALLEAEDTMLEDK